MKSKEIGADKVGDDANDEVIFKIDVPANRCGRGRDMGYLAAHPGL